MALQLSPPASAELEYAAHIFSQILDESVTTLNGSARWSNISKSRDFSNAFNFSLLLSAAGGAAKGALYDYATAARCGVSLMAKGISTKVKVQILNTLLVQNYKY